MPQQSAAEYLRHGQMPFFRLPVADLGSATPYAGADAVLLGVPYDGAVTYQPGARLAPYHLRRTSALVQTFHPVHQLDVFRSLKAFDGGNVAFPRSMRRWSESRGGRGRAHRLRRRDAVRRRR